MYQLVEWTRLAFPRLVPGTTNIADFLAREVLAALETLIVAREAFVSAWLFGRLFQETPVVVVVVGRWATCLHVSSCKTLHGITAVSRIVASAAVFDAISISGGSYFELTEVACKSNREKERQIP